MVLDSEDGSNSQRIAAHEMLNLFSYGDSDGDDDSNESDQGVWIRFHRKGNDSGFFHSGVAKSDNDDK